MKQKTSLMEHVRQGIIGNNHYIDGPYGKKKLLYADWTASGRLYGPIEEKVTNEFGPFVANTHTESNTTGAFMTKAYREAIQTIKNHVGANEEDIFIASGTGVTGAICKLQRILGLRIPEQAKARKLDFSSRPVVFITHMEHHSNHTSWLECDVDVVVIPPDEHGGVCLENLNSLLNKYHDRPLLIGSFTACSNVTGVSTPYRDMASLMHQYGGYCFVDFAASAPYEEINIHPSRNGEHLDAIFFSPHKFLGGPGTNGILIFNNRLYKNTIPDHPGGGTVEWTNPWGEKRYIKDIEEREDGGTPGFLQMIRTALCIRLKEQMTSELMRERDEILLLRFWSGIKDIPSLHILSPSNQKRIPIISFYLNHVHYNLIVKLLDDRFGIQARGGCSCAGTYGHFLLGINQEKSKSITDELNRGNLKAKPGWVRISLHPTMTIEEIDQIAEAIHEIALNADEWAKDYMYNSSKNEFINKRFSIEQSRAPSFDLPG